MVDGLISDEYVKAGVPLHRAGTLDDMGGLVLFLTSRVRLSRRATSSGSQKLTASSSQAGSYLNGTVQLIDGGRLLLYPSSY